MKIYIVLKINYNGRGCWGVETFDAIYDTLEKAVSYRESILVDKAKNDPYNIDDFMLPICVYDLKTQKMKYMFKPNAHNYPLNIEGT